MQTVPPNPLAARFFALRKNRWVDCPLCQPGCINRTRVNLCGWYGYFAFQTTGRFQTHEIIASNLLLTPISPVFSS
jgi:hypothetical protein